jgi:periplasmic protein CpxP/Spy
MKILNKIRTIAIAFALSVAVAAPIVMAQSTDEGAKREQRRERGEFGKRGGHHGMGRMFGQLDLTDAQKTQMKQIRKSSHQSLLPLMQEIRAKRQEIRQAHQGGAVDENLVRQKLTEIAPLEAKLMAERQRVHQQMLSVLTPEQKTKLDQLREQFKSRRGERGARKGQRSL